MAHPITKRWIRPEDDERLRGIFDGDRVLSLSGGQHRVVAERRGKPAGAIVAREVLIDGASAECSGLMEVTIFSGGLRAGYKVRVEARGGQVETCTAEALALGAAAILAREGSVIYVASPDVSVEAHDDSLVIMPRGCTARVKLLDEARVILRPIPGRAIRNFSTVAQYKY